MSDTELPRLAITMGDPAGIGPEVILKALARRPELWEQVVIFGAEEVLREEDRFLAGTLAEYRSPLSAVEIEEISEGVRFGGRPAGRPDERCATMQSRALTRGIEAMKRGDAQALVTAPINKALFRLIGEAPQGHTERLADAFGVDDVVMMLAGPRLRVALVTTHCALSEVATGVTPERVRRTVTITAGSLRREFGVDRPRVALCALNPHAGERGTMGEEEQEWIGPLADELRRELRGVELVGPLPSDTLFSGFRTGQPYDAVVALYHDQGLIPLKLLHFGESANITLGLPVVRTSVDHGTAYDIAGQGRADEGSMVFALQSAWDLWSRRSRGER